MFYLFYISYVLPPFTIPLFLLCSPFVFYLQPYPKIKILFPSPCRNDSFRVDSLLDFLYTFSRHIQRPPVLKSVSPVVRPITPVSSHRPYPHPIFTTQVPPLSLIPGQSTKFQKPKMRLILLSGNLSTVKALVFRLSK